MRFKLYYYFLHKNMIFDINNSILKNVKSKNLLEFLINKKPKQIIRSVQGALSAIIENIY